MRRLLVIATVLASAAGPARAAPKLSPRYNSAFYGFSLCPPAGTQRERKTLSTQLVSWIRRDERTGAIRWSLDVLRTRQKPTDLPPAEYAKATAEELARTHRFKVDSTRVGTVAGRPAMHFRGIWSGAVRLWRRQTWVRVKPGHYLVLNIAGTEAAKDEMDAVLTAVTKTLRLFDPAEARKRRAESMKRGAGAMAKLSDAALAKLVSGQTSYYLMKLKNSPVGFVRTSEAMTKREGAAGLRVVRIAAVKMPRQPRQLVREELFASSDRTVERWRRVTVVGQGAAAGRSVQEALKQNDLILLHSRSRGRPRKSRRFEVPEALRASYLPYAMGIVAPRLLARSKPGAYGFAVFNPTGPGFDLRTIQVLGTETITLAGKRLSATHLTDRMADDAPQADVWVDGAGLPLTMKTPDGLTIERTVRGAVVARFTAELLDLEKLSAGPGSVGGK